MPRTADASSVTRFTKINAQSLRTPTAKPTQSTAQPVSIAATASVVKATAVAAAVAPRTTIVAIATTKVNTKKRG